MAKIVLMRLLAPVFFVFACCVFMACSNDVKGPTDTTSSGNLDISVDETYKPVIEREKEVFDSSFPNAHVVIHYKPESECIKDFLEEKTRLILVTRDLNEVEKKYCEKNFIVPTAGVLARDAVAVILNPASTDTILSLATLQGILTGQYKKKYTVVFDNQGSSTVRYVEDSVLKGLKLGTNVFAAKGNDSVVTYVSKNPDAIGLVGLSYVSNDTDIATGSFISKVKVAALENEQTQENLQPYQAYIAMRTYPLSRNLYFIKSENYMGLASGFSSFLMGQRGQLIFHHAHLFPLRSNIIIREANLNQKQPGQ